ncbi:hypothetical protein PVL29_026184 [Vitis rotundifolia]|uniref:Uncharacterized protein n=1 Tax=Vitis rotundifolia TaxID=103349 RepID=A0AA38YLV3_VITRO|nr:hypothetical protein PVL29_026184 [Vitis rotundifolia]
MVGLGKLSIKRTRSISAQNPSSFLSIIVEAPTPTPVTKSTPPPSRPLQSTILTPSKIIPSPPSHD